MERAQTIKNFCVRGLEFEGICSPASLGAHLDHPVGGHMGETDR